MSHLIAERIFQNLHTGASVAVRLFAPIPIKDSSEWSCNCEIQGIGDTISRQLIGVDSFQALSGAIRVLCVELQKHESKLTFLDGSPGDTGMPIVYPLPFFESSLRLEIYDLIDKTVQKKIGAGT